MNARLLFSLAAIGLVFYILISVLLDGGNVIGGVAFYASLGSCLLGLLKPGPAMRYLVILAAYSDLLKRLMILDGRFGMLDILWVRALCPMTLAGIFAGVMARGLNDGSVFKARNMATLLLCAGGFGLAGISAYRAGGGLGALTSLADGAAYVFLLFIVPGVMRTPGEILRFVKFTLIVFVPVALYGIKQQLMGLSAFEIDYLKSGFTILSKHLEDGRPRPFSTLTDSSPFGTSCAVCACLALMVRAHYRSNHRRDWSSLGLILWVVFVCGTVASLTRTSNVNWLLPMLLIPFFSRGGLTALVYVSMAAAFVGACVFAQPLKEIVTGVTLWGMDNFGGSALGEQLTRFWTLGARLDGMHELAHNPKMWTMFGYGPKVTEQLLASGEVASHDIISNILLKSGWVSLLILVVLAVVCLASIHRSVLGLRGSGVFSMCLWLLAAEFGLIVHNVFAGNVTATFPVNFFFWFNAGAVNAIVMWQQARQPAPAAVQDQPTQAVPNSSHALPAT